MPLITSLKLGAVNNLSDARFAAGSEADYIGFCLDADDERFLEPAKLKEIAEWVEGPELVAEFGNQDTDTIQKTLSAIDIHWVQVNQHFNDYLEALPGKAIQKITFDRLASGTPEEAVMRKNADEAEFFVVEISPALQNDNPLGSEDSLNFLASLCSRYKVMLDLPFTTDNVVPLLDKLQPFGINIKGDDEVKPGYRNFDELIDLLERLEAS